MSELDVGSIVMRIRADASGVQEGLSRLESAMSSARSSTKKAGEDIEKSNRKAAESAQDSSAKQAAAYAAIALAATKMVGAIMGAIDDGIKAINRYQAALIGLDSVAKGQGVSHDAMTDALNKVTDAFFDVASASTAFKNLLARGYDIDQATNAILRLKDSAAFGRQASLGLAEAVVTATEGLKNENSILVDNAGVTKNVSVMWREYAESIGTTVDKLTQQQKVQAEVKGIMKETQFQVGDLAKLQDTLAGSQAKAAMAGEKLAIAYGSAMSPAVQAVTEVITTFLSALTDIVNAVPGLVAGLTGVGIAMAGLMIITKVRQAMQMMNITLGMLTTNITIFGVAINSALPWLAAIGAVVGIATAIFTNHKKAQEEAAGAAKLAAEKEEEYKKALEESVTTLSSLRDRYEELSKKTNLTLAESQELLQIEQTLASQFGITGSAIDTQADKYNSLTGQIDKTIEAKLRELQIDKEKAAETSRIVYEEAQARSAAAAEYAKLDREQQRLTKEIQDAYNKSQYTTYNRFARSEEGSKLVEQLYQVEDQMGKISRQFELSGSNVAQAMKEEYDQAAVYVRDQMAVIAGEIEIGGTRINKATQSMLERAIFNEINNPSVHVDPQALLKVYEEGLKNVDLSNAVNAMSEVNRKILTNAAPTDKDMAIVQNSMDTIYRFVQQTGEALGMTDYQMVTIMQNLAPVAAHLMRSMDDVASIPKTLMDQWKAHDVSEFIGQSAEQMSNSMKEMDKAVQDEIRAMNTLGDQMRNERGVIAALEALKKAFTEGNKDMAKSASDTLKSLGVEAPKDLAEVETVLARRVEIQRKYSDDMGEQWVRMIQIRGSYEDKLKALESEGRQGTQEYRAIKAFIALIDEAGRAAAEAQRGEGIKIVADGQAEAIDFTSASTDELIKKQEELTKSAKEAAERNAELVQQMNALQIVQQGMLTGETDTAQYKAAYEYLKGIPEFAYGALDSINSVTDAIAMQDVILAASTISMGQDITSMQTMIDGLKERLAGLAEDTDEYIMLDGLIKQMEQAVQVYNSMGVAGPVPFVKGFDLASASAEDLQKELDKATADANELTKSLELKANFRTTVTEIKRVAEAQKAGRATAAEWSKAQADAARTIGDFGNDAEAMANAASLAIQQVDGDLSTLEGKVQAAMNWISQLMSHIASSGASVSVNTSPAISALNALASMYNSLANSWLGKLLGWKPIGAKSGGGGGGGGGGGSTREDSYFKKQLDALVHDVRMGRVALEEELRRLESLKRYASDTDERRDIDERIYEKQQEIREKKISDGYAYIDHMKAINKMTIEEEQRALQQMRNLYTTMTLEEQREYDERVHDANQRKLDDEFRWSMTVLDHRKAMGELTIEQEISMLEQIKKKHQLNAESLMSIEERIYSLRNKLRTDTANADKAIIRETYSAIIEALKNRLNEERDLELKAVDEKIKALDDKTEAENEAKRRSDYAANLADKQRELAVTKSARKRRELQAEIEKMEANEELRRTQAARMTEKERLQEEKQAIQDRYKDLSSEENIRQEALRTVMSNNLQQMTDLISSYGGKWKDAGATLAEQLTEGISGGSSIVDTIKRLNEYLESSIKSQMGLIGSSLPMSTSLGSFTFNMYGTTVREEADIDKLAREMMQRVEAARR